MANLNFYQLLGVSPDASHEEIEAAYRRGVRALDAVRAPGPDEDERLKQLRLAYLVLSDPARRDAYVAAQQTQATRREWPVASAAPDPAAGGRARVIVAADRSGDYLSIEEALRSAPPHVRIVVRPGVYHESLVLDRTREIIGEGPPEEIRLRTTGMMRCIQVTDGMVTLRGLTITGPSGRATGESVVALVTGGRLVLEQCIIHGGDAATVLAACGPRAEGIFRRCTIAESGGVGVRFADEATGMLDECRILTHPVAGIVVAGGATPTARQCIVRSSSIGVEVRDGAGGSFETCHIMGSGQTGVSTRTGGNPTLRHCKIVDGEGAGIAATESGKGIFEECDITGNGGVGVQIGDDANPTLKQCAINGNAGEAVAATRASRGTIEGCNVTGNAGGPWRVAWGAKLHRRWNHE